jgi:UDP-N-acetylmuramoyl-L-alanine---L-glutamate ligase
VRFSALSGRRVAIWGLGREGRAALAAIDRHLPGLEPLLVDDTPPGEVERAALGDRPLALGEAGIEAMERCDVVLKSPGISRYRPEVTRLLERGVTVTSGTRLWFAEHADDEVVAITGTKGKSTTSALLAHLLAAQGADVILAGNIGVPLLSVLDAAPDRWVLELSSYQTSDLRCSPRIGVLLNLRREHLDWHGTLERYFADKLNLFGHRGDARVVLNAGDEEVRARAGRLPGVAWYGRPEDLHVTGEGIARGDTPLYAAGEVPLAGRHNLGNACAALTALELSGYDPTACRAAFATFRPLPHRIEMLGEREGRRWVDDSIATTPEAAVAAIEAMGAVPLCLLAGGQDRRQDYAPLAERVAGDERIVAVVGLPGNGARILGEIARALEARGRSGVALIRARGMEDAVAAATGATPAGGVVLLSPAAPSYDQYRDFEERGAAFGAAAGFAAPGRAPGGGHAARAADSGRPDRVWLP